MEKRMGVTSIEDGAFRFAVWAPNADQVSLVGDFNEWNPAGYDMERDDQGNWFITLSNAQVGQHYKFRIVNHDQVLLRQDPYARNSDNSNGNSIIALPPQQRDVPFDSPDLNRMVIYELHIGTFGAAENDASFKATIPYLDHLKDLGVNAIEVMPIHEFPGEISWGYNPSCLFAVESNYGTAQDFYDFVAAAHERGIAVILDVVYNHFGPSDLDLWQFDGWQENGGGGIYFYNDWRANTPWGDTRPDYGRPEVRQFLVDNAMMWAQDYQVDGLRLDMCVFMRTVNGMHGDPGDEVAEGWYAMQAINNAVHDFNPRFITIAEDMQDSEFLTKPTVEAGAGFNAQWGAGFVHAIRDALLHPDDAARDMDELAGVLGARFNLDVFQRVVYTESHDEVANGQARIPEDASPGSADSWHAKRKSLLGAGIVFTAPGVPMIFQGQEFLESGWFQDTQALDWQKADRHSGVMQAYKDLIALRLNHRGITAGLCGQHIQTYHVDNAAKVLAYHRWMEGGVGDSVVVIANFSHQFIQDYWIGLPVAGTWFVHFNSGSQLYDPGFNDRGSEQVEAHDGMPKGEMPASGTVSLAPYSLLILSQAQQG